MFRNADMRGTILIRMTNMRILITSVTGIPGEDWSHWKSEFAGFFSRIFSALQIPLLCLSIPGTGLFLKRFISQNYRKKCPENQPEFTDGTLFFMLLLIFPRFP